MLEGWVGRNGGGCLGMDREEYATVWVGSLGIFGQALDKAFLQGNSTFRGKGEPILPPKQTPSPQADPAAPE